MIISDSMTKGFITYKFWMGFNGFILLFLAVNMATIGVELDSKLAFIAAAVYLVYLFIYLSKNALWKLQVLFAIAAVGLLFYLVGIISGLTGPNLKPLAWTHIVLSILLLGGAYAHFKTAGNWSESQ
jgi:hypothetical protein